MKKLAIAACVFLTSLLVCGSPAAARRGPEKSAQTKQKASTRKASAKRTTHHRRHHYYSHRYRGPKKPTGERISEIQSALARGGYYHGDPNGKWDSSTVDAMRKFQEDHGLDGTGKIDALSLQKLGLGSEIAGVDAPHPPAPAPHALTPAQVATPRATPPAGPPAPDKSKPQTPKSPDAPSGTSSSSAHAGIVTPSSSKSKSQAR